MEYHHSRIKKINTKELKFLDQNDEERHIKFTDCRNNWIKYINNSEEYTTDRLTKNDTVCVAWRDAFNKPPYIEFFTEPKTRFIYPYRRTLYEWMRNSHSSKGYAYFRKTCKELEDNGWTTYDLG